MYNTDSKEDNIISIASDFGGLATDLIYIIERLDDLVSSRDSDIEMMQDTINEMQKEIDALQK